MPYYEYKGQRLTVLDVKRLKYLQLAINHCISGVDYDDNILNACTGLCANIDLVVFQNWLKDNYAGECSDYPLRLSNKQIREDLNLPENGTLIDIEFWFSNFFISKKERYFNSKSGLLVMPRGYLVYHGLAKYVGNVGKARLSMLNRFLSDLNFVG